MRAALPAASGPDGLPPCRRPGGALVRKNRRWPIILPPALVTNLYVDSWNPGSPAGAVFELNEANNRAERHGLLVPGALGVGPDPSSAPAFPPR